MLRKLHTALIAIGVLAGASGCATYTTPGRGADMAQFKPATPNEEEIAAIFERRSVATFPANVAVVRVQEPGYGSYSIHNVVGDGDYSIVTVRDIETEEDFERLAKLPMVAGIAPFNRLLVSGKLEGAESLRRVAAELHADLVLVYTIDTVFRENDHGGPVTLVSLGLLPTVIASVDSTASAILLDTRTGYLYGVAEASHSASGRTNAWWSQATIDVYRRETERQSFEKLLGEFERTWSNVVAQYARPATAAQAATVPTGG